MTLAPWLKSHPSRVRELKLKSSAEEMKHQESHPSRVRELKLAGQASAIRCASRTPPGCVN